MHTEYVEGCYGCELRHKGIRLSAAAIPSRQNSVPPTTPNPAWERGVAGEHRPDGSFMPYLTPDREPMPIKQYTETRKSVDNAVRRLKTEPTKE
jgi:hypothetical protein